MAVKAVEIAPAAYAEENTSEVQKEDDLVYDLGNMAAFDTHPFKYQNEKQMALHARENVQLLINHIFDLPREMTDMGPMAQLPEPEFVIPREKPLPKPKAETKWEKFAKEKGIVKRKKGRMVFDEDKEEWMPRWGYKRSGDDLKDWAIEMKPGDDLSADPWTKRKEEKKQRVEKSLIAQQKNLKRTQGNKAAPTGIPIELMNTDDVKAKQRGKEGVRKTLEKVQFSTASMGKFDKMREGESERKVKGKRNHFLPVAGQESKEKETSLNALRQVLGKDDKPRSTSHHDEDDDDNEGGGGKKKKRGRKIKNITKGHTKKRKM